MTFAELLGELNLPGERLKKINEALKAEYVSREEYERLSDNLKALKTEHEKKTRFLKQSKEDALGRQRAYYESRIKDQLIEIALNEARAKNHDIVRSLLETEKITLSESGTAGLTSQLTRLRKNAPFLFDDSVVFLTGYCPEASSDILPKINTEDMTYSQAVAYLKGSGANDM